MIDLLSMEEAKNIYSFNENPALLINNITSVRYKAETGGKTDPSFTKTKTEILIGFLAFLASF